MVLNHKYSLTMFDYFYLIWSIMDDMWIFNISSKKSFITSTTQGTILCSRGAWAANGISAQVVSRCVY